MSWCISPKNILSTYVCKVKWLQKKLRIVLFLTHRGLKIFKPTYYLTRRIYIKILDCQILLKNHLKIWQPEPDLEALQVSAGTKHWVPF